MLNEILIKRFNFNSTIYLFDLNEKLINNYFKI